MPAARSTVFSLSFLTLIALIMAVAARAAGDNWISTTSGAWGTAGNWSAGVPTNSSTATFNSVGGLQRAITLSAASSADSLIFSSTGGANAYTFDTAGTVNANTLTLTSGITNSAAATQTFYNTFALAGNQTWNAGAGALVFNGKINLGAGASSYALTITGSNSTTIAGIIANGGTPAGSLTYAGTGTLTLKGANTYTGATNINSGTVNLQHAGALGAAANTSATTVASGATLQLQANITTTNLGTLFLNGTGASGNGSLQNVSGNNRWNSDITLASSSTIFSSTAGNTLYIGNAAYGTNLFTMGSNTVTIDGPGNVWFDSNVGVSGDTGGFIKNGTGKVTFYGSNTFYTGATEVNNGTLDLIVGPFNAGIYGVNGTLTIGDNLGSAGSAIVNIASNTYGGQISPTSAVTINADGALNVALTNSVGSLALSGGQVNLANVALTLNGNVTTTTNAAHQTALISGGSLALGTTRTFDVARDAALTSDLTISSGITSGAVTKQGAGILTLSGANTYTGATTINAGALALGASNVLADTSALTIASGATFDLGLGHSDTVGALSGAGSIDLKNGTLTAGTATSSTFSGVIGDSGNTGSFTKQGAGTLTLSGASTYSGATTVNAGTLLFSVSNVLSSSTAVTIASGATVDLGWGNSATVASLSGAGTLDIKGGPFTVGDATSTVFSGVIKDSGGYGTFVKQGSGTLTVSGANTFNGVTTINAGALNLQSNTALGTSTSGNTIASGAALQLQNNLSVTEGSFGLAGSGIGSTGAIRNLSGTNTLNSAINLNASSTLGSDAGTLNLTGNFNLGSGQTLTTTGAGAINLSGALNGSSGLTQSGPGNLTLSGTASNSYTGATQINDGTLYLNKTSGTNAIAGGTVTIGDGAGAANSASLTLLASNQIADYSGLITVNSDGQLNLNNQSEQINTVAGTGTIATGSSGYLGIGVNSGSSSFGGSLTGTGVIEKIGSGTLTFNSSFNFGGELRITSGTVALAGITGTIGTLHITGNTVLDFGNSSASILNATTLTIDAGITLTITNWISATDFFYVQNFTGATLDTRGMTPGNQITFTGSSNNDTVWQSYDHQIVPAPEPATYGALFVALCLGVVGLRCRRSRSS